MEARWLGSRGWLQGGWAGGISKGVLGCVDVGLAALVKSKSDGAMDGSLSCTTDTVALQTDGMIESPSLSTCVVPCTVSQVDSASDDEILRVHKTGMSAHEE